MAALTTDDKNRILYVVADALETAGPRILEANAEDVAAAKAAGISNSLIDRLILNEHRIKGVADAVRNIAALPDPVGRSLAAWTRSDGLRFRKVSVPIGVIGIIYESRPNVTVDAAMLCLKSSNAVILRGGTDAGTTNQVLAEVMTVSAEAAGLPKGAIQLVRHTDRDAVKHLVQMDEYVHMIIPRGGESLIRAVAEMARVPVLKHYKGVCHIYVDASADQAMALAVIENAKCQRPGVCNAAEKVLVHQDIAADFLPAVAERLEGQGVELRVDEKAAHMLPNRKAAQADDWDAEYLDLILTVGVVDSVEAAIAHINRHGSGHSDAIIARDAGQARLFQRDVDSATVYVNASTRFTDGGEFGFGAEIGISTDRLHARGPAGLEALTTYKYLVEGEGHIRA